MFRKTYLIGLLTIALFLIGSTAAFAQNGPVRGKIEMTKADGSKVGVPDALVEAYRLDIKASFQPSKTDKKGYFSFAGLPIGAKIVLVVSGAGIRPEIQGGISAGMDSIIIPVVEGDGTKYTEAQVREAIAAGGSTQTQAPQETEENKKKREEYERQKAEVENKNKKIQEGDAIVRKSLEDGSTAYKAKNYDLAVTKFEEGITAVPDYAGSTPVLLNYKGVALKDRGFNAYVEGAKDKSIQAAKYESAKKDWNTALDSFNRGLEIIKAATPPTDPNEQKNREATKLNLLANSAEVHRLMVESGVDMGRASEASKIYEEYLPLETDPAKKLKFQISYANILFNAGDNDNSIAQYRKVLEAAPDNPDALAGLGLVLVNAGALSGSKEQTQEGVNFLDKFLSIAPDTHRLKPSIKEALDEIKREQQVTPQKNTKTTTTKKKN